MLTSVAIRKIKIKITPIKITEKISDTPNTSRKWRNCLTHHSYVAGGNIQPVWKTVCHFLTKLNM